MKTLALWIISGYRAALVPFFGPSCRFEPSCSRYAQEAIETHGFWRGCALAFWRVCRCHPFSRAGFDPVPIVGDSSVGQAGQGCLTRPPAEQGLEGAR
jgi:putative membrane protein insertion efficiency factor